MRLVQSCELCYIIIMYSAAKVLDFILRILNAQNIGLDG